MKKLIVIIPAFCEEQTICKTIESIKEQRESLKSLGLETLIYVVNDGSTDQTVAEAQRAGADRVLNHRINQGLGSAVRTGLKAARKDGADLAVKFDADLQHDPADIVKLVRPILDDEAELVYGNRFKGMKYKMPFVRRMGNLAFTRLMRWMTGWPVTDSQPGVFAVAGAYLDVSYIPGDYNYTQQILLDAYHKGMRFCQVPVSFARRDSGTSFVSMKYPLKVFPQIMQVLIGVKPLKVFGPVGFFFIGICILVSATNLINWIGGSAAKPIQNVNLVLGAGMFGLQTLFFGLLADLIVKQNSSR